MFIHLLTIPKVKFLTHNSLAIAYFIFLAIGLCGLPWSGNRYLYSFGHAMPPGPSQAAAARCHCTHHHSHHSLPPLPSLARALSQLGALGVGLELDAVCGGASAVTTLDGLCLVRNTNTIPAQQRRAALASQLTHAPSLLLHTAGTGSTSII